MPTKTTPTTTAPLSSVSHGGLCAIAACVWGVAAAVHYYRLGLSLAHYDARAHLVVARRVFDSLTPGWQQVGAVWLPLPHLLNAIPVQMDWLYRTGYSAIATSIASMALAVWSIVTLVRRATGSTLGGVVAAALLMLNPDVLYLQSTPMTEPLLFGMTFLAIALIGEWTATVQPGAAGSTIAPGWACIAAVLTRYEAWPIIGAALLLAFAALLQRGWTPFTAARAVRGLALWPSWAIAAFLVNSKVSVGSWFVSTGFFVAENPARGHLWLAWTQVWDGLVRLTGPAPPWIAVGSAAAILIACCVPPNRRAATGGTASDGPAFPGAALLVLALAGSAAVPLYAYFKGHPVRVRYDVPLVAAAAAMTGMAVGLLPRRARGVAAAIVVAVAVFQASPFDANAPVVVESQRETPNRLGRAQVTAYLRDHWDGQPILMSMGSLGHYMHDLSASGFAVKDFLHEGNGEIWIQASRAPRPFVAWIAIEERAEGGDALHWQATHDSGFLKGYARVAEGGGVALYRRTGR